MKDKSEIRHTGRAVFYTVLYPKFREAALELGYTLALHGSMASDMDLIAIPWGDSAASEIELVKAISDCLGETIWKEHHFKNPAERPHNRVTYTLSIYSDWYIDLSIMKLTAPSNNSSSEMVEVKKALEDYRQILNEHQGSDFTIYNNAIKELHGTNKA